MEYQETRSLAEFLGFLPLILVSIYWKSKDNKTKKIVLDLQVGVFAILIAVNIVRYSAPLIIEEELLKFPLPVIAYTLLLVYWAYVRQRFRERIMDSES